MENTYQEASKLLFCLHFVTLCLCFNLKYAILIIGDVIDMNDKTKKVIAGVSAGAILATMAGCESAKQKNKEEVSDLENSTKLEDSTIGSTTEEELSSFLNDYDIAFPEDKTTTRYNSDDGATTKSGGRIDEETTKVRPPETTKVDPIETTKESPPTTTEYNGEDEYAHKTQQEIDTAEYIKDFKASQEFYDKYFADYEIMKSMNNLDNVLIVMTKYGVETNFGATFIVAAPNYTYFLQYEDEEAREKAYEGFQRLKEEGKIYSVERNVIQRIM